MILFLNGRFVPEEAATVSVFDRGFLYGDGLFETLRVCNGRVFRWAQHLERLERGAAFLGINIPFTREALGGHAADLIQRNGMPEALLRITLSRGAGVRGYSPRGADKPTLVMTLHPIGPADPGAACAEAGTPIRWRVHTAGFRLPAGEKAAQFKTCNKLVQVLARAEAEAADADEALLLNTDGFVVEAASGNLLWIREGAVCTPPIASGILPGVTREVVQALCSGLKLPCLEADIRPAELRRAEAVFITLSSHGIVEVTEIDGARAGASPITGQLYRAYLGQIRAECGGGPAESVCTWPF